MKLIWIVQTIGDLVLGLFENDEECNQWADVDTNCSNVNDEL